MRRVALLYGRRGLALDLPDDVTVLEGADPPPLADPGRAVRQALERPLGAASLAELVAQKRPASVAITISDITRPVPNALFLPPMIDLLQQHGVPASSIAVIIGTGMHRPSTRAEREELLGPELLSRGLEVIDHRAAAAETLVQVSADPLVRVNRRFVEADLRIVTGYIEPHFMAGFSGGRKGVCPALTDLATIERFHSYDTLAAPLARSGVLEGNPCHAIALQVARRVGVDLLFNVALTRDRRVAGVYCGELDRAHRAGCAEVAGWTTARVPGPPFDLVITCGGGYPLDQTFYQSVKGQVEALPALGPGSTLLQVSHCGEGLGSPAYRELLLRWGQRWREALQHLRQSGRTELDQWELQMQIKVLSRVGLERLWLASDGLADREQRAIAVTPLLGPGDARARSQRAVDGYLSRKPDARVAVIPDGPYVMLERVGQSAET